jgi:uncharacterized NAD-dependent epimerase/dehydratase family protein
MDLRSRFDTPAPAVVLAEGAVGEAGGKTAHGVVLHSEVFDARAVVDSETAGRRPADILGRADAPDVPVVEDIEAALEIAPEARVLVIGVAPAGGALPASWEPGIERAIRAGCDVVSGLHVFLGREQRWQRLAADHGVDLIDVREPPAASELRVADGDRGDGDVVAVLGTDCAVGKRTTTFELYRAAREAGVDAGWVATGQTGIMVGAQRGTVIDRVPSDFAAGAVESMVEAVGDDHELVFVEGQAALSHRAYSGVTLSILHGAWPDAVVLADEPGREQRAHFDGLTVDGVGHEIGLIERLAEAPVVALSTWGEPDRERERHGIPAANVHEDGGPVALLGTVLGSLDRADGDTSAGDDGGDGRGGRGG